MATQISTPTYTPSADGVYVAVLPPTPLSLPQIETLLGGIVGTGTWGPLNTPIFVSDAGSLYDAVGVSTGADNEITTEALCAFDQGRNLVLSRASHGDDSAAAWAITDGAQDPASFVTLFGIWSGTRANGATITISSAPTSTVAKPTLRVAVRFPNASPEIFDNIVAWKATGNQTAFDMATAIANVVAAINVGTSARGPSNYVAAQTGNSTASGIGSSVLGTAFLPTSLGSDGSDVTTQDLIGVDGTDSQGRTGMYALRGTGIDTFILAGCDDPTAGPTQAEFAESEQAFALTLLAGPGAISNVGALLATKQNNNIESVYSGAVASWTTIRDSITGLPRQVSPLGYALGEIISQPPEASIGNQPAGGFLSLLSAERGLSQPGASNLGLVGQSFSGADQDQLASGGILYISNQMPRQGGKFGFAHGRNASGIPGQDGIEYTRLTNYLVKGTWATCGPFVDLLQSQQANDPLRNAIAGSLRSWLTDMKNKGRIDDFTVTADLTVNSFASIAAGYLFVVILVRYLSAARYIIPSLQGGTNVVTVAQALPNAA